MAERNALGSKSKTSSSRDVKKMRTFIHVGVAAAVSEQAQTTPT